MQWINEASWDRVARVALGLAMLGLGWTGTVTGGWGAVLRWGGFLPLITGLVGFCPAYRLFGMSTGPARPATGNR
jgi:hypothetical protein